MATVTSSRATTGFQTYTPVGRGAVGFEYGTYEIASALSAADIVEFCVLPACLVVDGFLRGDDIDTGTETLEIDVGTSANTDLLLDSGVITGDAVTDHLPAYATAANFYLHYNGLKDGPVTVSSEVTLIGTVTAVAAAGGTGTLYCGNYIIAPDVES